VRQQEPLRNVSRSGLCFRHPEAVPVGSNIVVRIALTVPLFEASCRVTWCQADGNTWQVGVEFLDRDILFRLRMVEQTATSSITGVRCKRIRVAP